MVSTAKKSSKKGASGAAKATTKPKQTEEERLAAETKELAKSMMSKKEARCVGEHDTITPASSSLTKCHFHSR